MAESKAQSGGRYRAKSGKSGRPDYVLRLFVSGLLQNSARAIKNINQICEQHFKGNYSLEVIDINQQPELALHEQIIVIPVMLIKFPLPERRIIGDLSDSSKVLEILNYK
ncbi:MAG TPA: circadian clock KaiB family protein [Puia sp.]|nr:circadian clock KaiB family protein [Puia sp.]